MKVYAALLIDGAEEGLRIPANMHLAVDAFARRVPNIELDRALVFAPAKVSGHAVIAYFASEFSEDLVLEVIYGPISAGQMITYTPPLSVEPPDPAADALLGS